MLRAFLIALLLATPAAAQNLVLGLSESEVAITTTFDGSDILVFGAIKHESAVTQEAKLDLIVTVKGPDQATKVYRKDRRFGIWVHAAPSFYAIETTRPIADILGEDADRYYEITLPRVIKPSAEGHDDNDVALFTEALMRIRQDANKYQLREWDAALIDNTLFRTDVELPANLVEGAYEVSVFLLNDKKVISTYSTVLDVRKAGLERWMYNLSRQKPFYYGILSLIIAISAGWGASAIFRVFQR
jgi:uncharacterized protein (TIGR02186 family)